MIKNIIAGLVRRVSGLASVRADAGTPGLPDIEPEFASVIEQVRPFTMTSPERIYSLCKAVDYVATGGISGAIVECGVWRGGSMMAAALTLRSLGVSDRELYLFDTFQGMTSPTIRDRTLGGRAASEEWQRLGGARPIHEWCNASLEDVTENMRSTGYDERLVHCVSGAVEATLPSGAPQHVAILRLDTDWYESTKHELTHLYPRLVPGGVLIVDDYGHWRGARQAVDEYFSAAASRPLLVRVDYTGRVAVKPFGAP